MSSRRLPARRLSAHRMLTALALLAAWQTDIAQAGLPDLVLEHISDQVVDPADLQGGEPGRIYVTQLRGQVVILEDGKVQPTPLLDVSDRVPPFGHGLQSTAVHPGGRYVFLHRVEKDTGHLLITRMSRSDQNPDRVNPGSEVILVRIPKERFQHFGGRLRFGPDDYLYISTGDDSEEGELNDPDCAAQSLDRFEGKMLRLDVDRNVAVAPYYAIPADNPFVGNGQISNAHPEIWATGLRNPWRFSFDRETGDLWIGDVGEDDLEEVNRQPASSAGGENYGWKRMEGTSCFDDAASCGPSVPACNSTSFTRPEIEYTHTGGGCAVTGGLVYRGSLIPELYGRYLYADFCSGQIWVAQQFAGFWSTEALRLKLPTVVSFTEDADGEVYLSASGGVYHLVDPTLPDAGVVELTVQRLDVSEANGRARVTLRRLGQGNGAVTVRIERTGGTASNGDFSFETQTVSWADDETGSKTFDIALINDSTMEDDETIFLELNAPQGGAILGPRTSLEILIKDDDTPTCVADSHHLCLTDGRFRVSVAWKTANGLTGEGNAVTLGEDAGMFWFFSANNPEIFTKVLDACFAPFQHFWVFAAGLTDVETSLTVVDTTTGEVRRYDRPLGQSYEAVRDTMAFATCP